MSSPEIESVPVIVFSDAHGRHMHIQKIINQYPGAIFVSNGDAVGPPDEIGNTRDTLEIILTNDVVCVAGNHEAYLLGAVTADKRKDREELSTIWVDRYDRGISREYGVQQKKNEPNEEFVVTVWEAIDKVGHLEYFDRLVPYFEIPDELIVVHAGLVDGVAYQKQLRGIDQALTPEHIAKRQVQIFGGKDEGLPKTLGAPKHAGFGKSSPVLVTGHKHSKVAATKRQRDNGKRVHLASEKKPGSGLYVYDHGEGLVRSVSVKSKKYKN